MIRLLIWSLLLAMVPLSGVRAQQEGAKEQGKNQGDKIAGKTSLEWMRILEKDDRERYRRAAVIALELFGSGERGVIRSLLEAVERDKSSEIRITAILALGRMGGDAKTAIRTLTAIMAKDKSPEVREAAAKALGGKMVPHSKTAIPALAEALKDSHTGTRAAAASSLKDLGKESRLVLPALLQALKDPKMDRFTRMYVAQTLSLFSEDSSTVVPALVALLQEPKLDNTLKQVLVDGLGGFGKAAGQGIEPLLNLFQDGKSPLLLRQSAAVALVKLEPECAKVWPVVKTAFNDPEKLIRAQAIRLAAQVCRTNSELVPALMESCRDSSPDVQIAAIQELGELGSAARPAEATLTAIANGAARRSTREAATISLKKIRGEKGGG